MILDKRTKSNRRFFLIGILLICVLSWAFPTFEASSNRHDLTNVLSAPSWKHLLGTDAFGRDVFFRSLYGLRSSLSIALVVSLITAMIGLTLGVLCATYTNAVLYHGMLIICDSFITFPGILLALLMVLFLPQGFISIAVILFVLSVPYFIRLALVESLQIQSQEFILSAYCIGCRKIDVLFAHYMPNLIPRTFPLVIQTILVSIHIESVLSYFGIGIQPPYASLGFMIYEARRYSLTQASMLYFPLFMLFLVSLALFFVQKKAQ